jgi:hypothetical protein
MIVSERVDDPSAALGSRSTPRTRTSSVFEEPFGAVLFAGSCVASLLRDATVPAVLSLAKELDFATDDAVAPCVS